MSRIEPSVEREPSRGRHQEVLLELAALDKSNTENALRRIVEEAAKTLGIERVNWWSLREDPPAILCEEAFVLSTSQHDRGVLLYEADYPRYFHALRQEQVIAADDARTDPRTSEFADGYLAPLGIVSMLDVPVWLGGRLAGVLCHEWIGVEHRWSAAEVELATSMGQLIATTLEMRELRAMTERERLARDEIRARDEFLSVASHELYTPLASLQLAVDALRTRQLSEIDAERSLAVVDRQVNRLTQLVSSLLDATRVHAGHLRLTRELFDLVEVAREVAERFANTLAVAGTQLTVTSAKPVCGRWDRSRLDQVVTNLVANAAKFARGKRIEVFVEDAGPVARIKVKDEGIGIPADQLPRIFQRFERAVSAQSYGGLGLGLFIVRGIVEAHGGTVSATSIVGQGTEITVELPVDDPAASAS